MHTAEFGNVELMERVLYNVGLPNEECPIRAAALVRAEFEKRDAFYNLGMAHANGYVKVLLGGLCGKDDITETYDPTDPYSEALAVLKCADKAMED